MFWYLAAWTVGILVARMILGEESAAGLGRESVALLWFLGVYLVVLAFVPALTRLRTGRGRRHNRAPRKSSSRAVSEKFRSCLIHGFWRYGDGGH